MINKVLFVFAVIITPFWILGISTKIAFNEWFIDYEYSKPNFPKDRWGLSDEVRKKLAKLGLKAVLTEEGLKEFEKARLPSGRKAFRKKEVKHMEDLNRFLSKFFIATYILAIFWLFVLILHKKQIWKLLICSSIYTFLFLAVVSLTVFSSYEKAFEVFHNFFFGRTSWRFSKYDTLLRIYPMKFWFDGTTILAIIAFFINTFILSLGIMLRRKYAKA